MKAQVIILTILLGLLSVKGFAKTNDPQDVSQQKTVKSKYDFNLFKFFSLEVKLTPIDSSAIKERKQQIKRRNN
jgi:hypothetical protein